MKKSGIGNSKPLLITLLTLSALLALAGVSIMTDFGQTFKISKDIVVFFFKYNRWIIGLSFISLITAAYINYNIKFIKTKLMIVLASLWLLAILGMKYITPYLLFPTQQYNAEFVEIDAVDDKYLSEDEAVFVIDLNGVQKAYPRKNLWQAHVVGSDFDGQEVLLTYCVFTNLPSPYINEPGENEMEFKVLAQTNNNLLLWDINSGEIIQQINSTCEFSKNRLEPIPVMEMTWRGFEKLYPNGSVYYNPLSKPIERIISLLFNPEEAWYGEDWMFKTSNFDDKRFPSKEHLIGISNNDSQLAISKELIINSGKLNVEVGDKKMAVVYFPEYETIGAFNRALNDSIISVDTIDVFGNTPNGQLKREFIFNSVLWSVWVYYYPNTEILKNEK